MLGLIALFIVNINGIRIGSKNKKSDAPASTNPNNDPVELERAKRRYTEEQDAFQKMMNFNAFQAYGMEEHKE